MGINRIEYTLETSEFGVIRYTGQTVGIRRKLLSELAVSNDKVRAISNLVQSCIVSNHNVEELPYFITELLYFAITSKTNGEIIPITYTCNALVTKDGQTKPCKTEFMDGVILDKIKLTKSYTKNTIVNLVTTPNVSITLRYLNFAEAMEWRSSNIDRYDFISKIVTSVFDGDEIIEITDINQADQIIDNLSLPDATELVNAINNWPAITYTVKTKCPSCGHTHDHMFRGFESFFQ